MNFSGIFLKTLMLGLDVDKAVEIGGKGDEKRQDCCDGRVWEKGER